MEARREVPPAEAGGTPAEVPAHTLTIVPVRRYGRWLSAAIALVIALSFVYSIANNPNFQWPVFFHYLFAEIILQGLGLTLWLTVVAMVVGIVLGIVLAVMRMSANPVVSGLAAVYLWFFRGTPVLVQLIFWYNLAALFPVIAIGIPFGPKIFEGSANDLITPFVASVIALGLNEGAYMAEIVRAGIIAVDRGQNDAALALGMSHPLALAAHHPAAGAARDHAAGREPVHLAAEGHVPGVGDRRRRHAHRGAEHFLGEPAHHRADAGGDASGTWC